MSAGYIQLSAIGQQDAYLTGSPQVTYFAGVYKRHTPFVLEAYDIPFVNQNVNFGQNNICRIPPKGDLIRALALKITLPPLPPDPGLDWAWPIQASANPQTTPNVFIHPSATNTNPIPGGSGFEYLKYQGITFYSTFNIPEWLPTDLESYIQYNLELNKFIFSNVSSIEFSGYGGLFWGLDPKFGVVPSTDASNLVYTADSFGIVSPTFSLEQAGWVRSDGLPNPFTNTSVLLYLEPETIYPNITTWTNPGNYCSGAGYQFFDLSDSILVNKFFTDYYEVTTGGAIKFATKGYYAVRAIFTTNQLGDISEFAFSQGQSTALGQPLQNAINDYNFIMRINPDPTMQVILPLTCNNTSNLFFFYANLTSNATQFVSPTYLSIQPVMANFVFTTSVSITSSTDFKVPFYNNVQPSITPSSALQFIMNSDSTFNFTLAGEYFLNCMFYLNEDANNSYITSVSLKSGTSTVYAYDMSLVGQNPTFVVSLPVTVTNLLTSYYITINTRNDASTLLPNTFMIVQQYGGASYFGYESVLNNNGIFFKSNGNNFTPGDPFNFYTDFIANGNSNIISLDTTTGQLLFSNSAAYMITAGISTQDYPTSLTFAGQTYSINQSYRSGELWTVSFLAILGNNLVNTDVSVTLTTSGSSGIIYPETFISIYPYASNLFPNYSATYYDSVGTYVIDNAQLKIGGQTVETITGEYIEIWNDLNVSYENQQALKLLVGKNDISNVYAPGRTYITNLPFYFYENPGLYLPIVSLERQDVEIWITLRTLQSLAQIDTSNITSPLIATIITEYVYLSDPEIAWFKRADINYTITQVQYQEYDLLPGFTEAIFDLPFINPVRELFFVVQLDGTQPYVWSNITSIKMTFNGYEAFTDDVTDALYLNSIEPLNHYINYPTRTFYMYSFANTPKTSKPTGQVNMSRIRNVAIQVTTPAYSSAKQLRVIGVNFNILKIRDGIAGVTFNSGNDVF